LDDCFIHIREGESTTLKERKQGFVIGSVREPCDFYVSQFAFTSQGKGYLFKYAKKHPDLLENIGIDSPFFNSTRDIMSFKMFLRHRKVLGRAAHHLTHSYMDKNELQVDCWVFVDEFKKSFLDCLHKYEDQGGYVNWTAKLVVSLVQSVEKEEILRRALKHDKNHISKNDPNGNPQLFHHGTCISYYDDETASLIENGPDNIIYDTFGYLGCCGKRKKNNLITESTVNPIKKKEILTTKPTIDLKEVLNQTSVNNYDKHPDPYLLNNTFAVDSISFPIILENETFIPELETLPVSEKGAFTSISITSPVLQNDFTLDIEKTSTLTILKVSVSIVAVLVFLGASCICCLFKRYRNKNEDHEMISLNKFELH